MITLFGTKQQMSQQFVDGMRVPTTDVAIGPCVVTQIKTSDKDGYWAIQLGFGTKKLSRLTNPEKGHISKAWPSGQKGAVKDKMAPKFLREIKMKKQHKYKVGDIINLSDVFKVGDTVQVTGISKGKGFAGGVKRWGFKGGPATHGQSDRPRSPGSIGQGTTPGRVRKGKKMAGRMGSDTKTVKNLKVVSIDAEKNTVSISGAVPGNRGTLLTIKKLKGIKRES